MPPKDKVHIITCTECREFTKEIIDEDREKLLNDFRTMIREEWQVTITIRERVTRIEKVIAWLIISQALQWLSTLTIIYFLLKHINK